MSNLRIDEAMCDPKQVFETPENLIADPRLDRTIKLQILHRWLQDAHALSVAEEEGMDGGEPSMLQRVQKAIDHLDNNGRR